MDGSKKDATSVLVFRKNESDFRTSYWSLTKDLPLDLELATTNAKCWVILLRPGKLDPIVVFLVFEGRFRLLVKTFSNEANIILKAGALQKFYYMRWLTCFFWV